jgi:cytochrome bd-type quinol oxidase subunit 2
MWKAKNTNNLNININDGISKSKPKIKAMINAIAILLFTTCFGYGASKLPYLLYPFIRINEHVVNSSMAIALIIAKMQIPFVK